MSVARPTLIVLRHGAFDARPSACVPTRRGLVRGRLHHGDHPGAPADVQPGQQRHAPARRALLRVRLPAVAMRIAFDVSPLSHERTGVNNDIRGSLARLRRGRCVRAGMRSSRSRRPRPRGRNRDIRRLRSPGIDVETRLSAAAGGARDPPDGRSRALRVHLPSGSSGGSTFCTSATGCTRRSAHGLRATTIHDLVPAPSSGVDDHPRTQCDALAQDRERDRDVRRDVRELGVYCRTLTVAATPRVPA